MSHPQCCKNPETCTLTYVEHLRGFQLGVNAIPTRAVHRSRRSDTGYKPPDEPAVRTEARERRWSKDLPAFKELVRQGYNPPRIDGAHKRAVTARSAADIEREV